VLKLSGKGEAAGCLEPGRQDPGSGHDFRAFCFRQERARHPTVGLLARVQPRQAAFSISLGRCGASMSDHRREMRLAGNVAVMIVAVMFGVCILAPREGLKLLVSLSPPPPPGYEQIRIGMSKLDVEALMGPSSDQSYTQQADAKLLQGEQWDDSDFIVSVQYDWLRGTVTEKRLFPRNPVDDVLFRLRDHVLPGLQETDESLGSQGTQSKEPGLREPARLDTGRSKP
jgi:hypothetical protein